MSSDYIILLDVHVEGMENILSDFKWSVKTVTKLFGDSEDARKDQNVITYAKSNKNCIVVSQDHDLIRRCRTLGIKVVGLEMDDLAKLVNEILKKEFS